MNEIADYLNSIGHNGDTADAWHSHYASAEKEIEELRAELAQLRAEYNSEVETATALGAYLDQARADYITTKATCDIYELRIEELTKSDQIDQNLVRNITKELDKAMFANEQLRAENSKLKDALKRFAKIDLTGPIGNEIAWDILNARAVLSDIKLDVK